ncbi:MAG: 6-bladed beta-propeller [Gemmatimonadota bacterium]
MSGCQVDAHQVGSITAFDSAGVRIVKMGGLLEGLPEPAVVESHDLHIGVIEGPEEYTFGDLADVRTLAGGDIVVADRTSLSLRVFDSEGRFLTDVGRPGSGPGEFNSVAIAGVDLSGIWVWDVWLQRLTRLDLGLEVVEERALRELGIGPITEVRMLPDGSGLARIRYSGSGSFEPEPTPLALVTDSLAIVRFQDSERVDTILVAVAEQQVHEAWRDAEGSIQGYGTLLPFGAVTLWLPEADGGVTAARSDRFELVRRDHSGGVTQISRLARSTRPLDPTQVSEMRDAHLAIAAGQPELLRAVHRSFEPTVLPRTMPVLHDLLVDSQGAVWVGLSPPFPEASSREWIILDEARLPMGRIEVGPDFRVTEVGADYLLGVQTDSLGAQHVRRYPFRWVESERGSLREGQ